ncbi:hypothetical protein RF11_15111 [Thelohanellus kitauei]|uniref:Uncharacterized protein n=1 Tax=Thelohanellus kitauei TaxID=669202 RepID=A0A0C2J7Y8_THEKT|nr:hypothetical protein RF11_15111 [Thelohanellus kitauei]
MVSITIEVFDIRQRNGASSPVHKIKMNGWRSLCTTYHSDMYYPAIIYEKFWKYVKITFSILSVFSGETEYSYMLIDTQSTSHSQSQSSMAFSNIIFIPYLTNDDVNIEGKSMRY